MSVTTSRNGHTPLQTGFDLPDFLRLIPFPDPPVRKLMTRDRARGLIWLAAGMGVWVVAGALTAFRETFGFSSRVAAWLLITLLCMGFGLILNGVYNAAFKSPSAASEVAPRGPSSEQEEVARNMEVVARYHAMAHGQASSSFRDSRIAMGVGFLFLVGAGIYAMSSAATNQTQIVVAALAALGSAIAAYLGATFIKTHNRALAQVHFFFGQPLVEGYLLRAQRVAIQMGSEENGGPLQQVVTAYLVQAELAASALGPWAEQRIGTPTTIRRRQKSAEKFDGAAVFPEEKLGEKGS